MHVLFYHFQVFKVLTRPIKEKELSHKLSYFAKFFKRTNDFCASNCSMPIFIVVSLHSIFLDPLNLSHILVYQSGLVVRAHHLLILWDSKASFTSA